MSDNEIIQAFHLMWGNFPEPVMITQKSREMIAVNVLLSASPKITKAASAIERLTAASLFISPMKELLARRMVIGFQFLKSLNG